MQSKWKLGEFFTNVLLDDSDPHHFNVTKGDFLVLK